MSHRNLNYFHRNRIVYRRDPINDIPTKVFNWGKFFEEGTYECYHLFRSSAKINSYRSFKWHILVLWYLNSSMDKKEIVSLAKFIADKDNGFISITLSDETIINLIDEVYKLDLDEPPKNKMRKIIFNDYSGLETSEKLSIVGKLIGRTRLAEPPDIYEAMLHIHDEAQKITVSKIARMLNVSTRTIYRNITEEIRQEKILLNEEV